MSSERLLTLGAKPPSGYKLSMIEEPLSDCVLHRYLILDQLCPAAITLVNGDFRVYRSVSQGYEWREVNAPTGEAVEG